jgi:hypothetical protein
MSTDPLTGLSDEDRRRLTEQPRRKEIAFGQMTTFLVIRKRAMSMRKRLANGEES